MGTAVTALRMTFYRAGCCSIAGGWGPASSTFFCNPKLDRHTPPGANPDPRTIVPPKLPAAE